MILKGSYEYSGKVNILNNGMEVRIRRANTKVMKSLIWWEHSV